MDDYHLGDEIIYTCEGGREDGSKKHIKDQSWDATGNKAVIVSEMHGLPVRVPLGYKHKTAYSPTVGYQYGGLYTVTDHFEEKGKDGFVICRFRSEKVHPLNLEISQVKKTSSNGTEESKRVPATTLRMV